MKLRKTLLCGVAATALGLAAALPTGTSILPGISTPAQAQQVSVSIGFGTFYDSLSPHGDWTRIEGRHVWVPGDVGADWRPYTQGRWAYTRPHGWTWVSDEPYGWAVYHYGRWGFHHNIGWYWVPDTVWAPAWVTWRGSGEYAAWAPMPPQGLVGISYEVDPYAVPARYWVVVPTRQFLAPNLFSVAITIGEPRFYDVVSHTRPIGHVRVVNNIVVNNYINVNYIESVTGDNVRIHQVNYASEPGAVSLGDDTIEIFAPTVEEETDAEPQQVRTPEEIAEERGVDMAAEPTDEQADQPIQLAEDAPELEETMVQEAAPVTEEDVAEDAEAEPEEDLAEDAEVTPEAEVTEDAEAEAEAEVTEDTEAETEADVAEEVEAEAEAEVAEEPEPAPEAAPEAEVAEEPEPAPEAAPEAEMAEEPEPAPEAAPEAEMAEPQPAEPDAPEMAEEPSPQVEERALGEPAAPAEEQPQPRGQAEEDDEELRRE